MTEDRPGFTDTPYLPGGEYRVHDPERPHPPRVRPGGPVTAGPPSDATVLFDGTDLSGWEAADGGEPGWSVADGDLVVEPGTGDVRTTELLGDCQIHVEWAAPADPDDATYPGNSGVFLADRYEVQVLDCSETAIYADGWVGAIYGQYPPLADASLPAGEWQSFDVVWRRPRFEDGSLTSPARVTVLYNGVLVQEGAEPYGPTTYRDVLDYDPHGPAPLRLQDHGFRVRFRNVWYRPL
ncbi:DUF1080 domain-containing protein [Halobacteriales archaeon QS_4_69_31]|nr:MAG: DUF1080 domain-containing protein [Halobacteriales archaeon QS_4_69_31]